MVRPQSLYVILRYMAILLHIVYFYTYLTTKLAQNQVCRHFSRLILESASASYARSGKELCHSLPYITLENIFPTVKSALLIFVYTGLLIYVIFITIQNTQDKSNENRKDGKWV